MITHQFIVAGDAIFTIEEPNGTHHTYRVQYVEKGDRFPEAWFVKLLTGPDNTRDYTYLGKVDSFTLQVKTTAKSAHYADSHTLKLLNRVLARIAAEDHDAYLQHGYRVHHEGRCGRCGRLLTVPESVESGFGPECSKILGLNATSSQERPPDEGPNYRDFPPPDDCHPEDLDDMPAIAW